MRLEYLPDGSPLCPLIRLFDFTPAEAGQLAAAVSDLAAGRARSAWRSTNCRGSRPSAGASWSFASGSGTRRWCGSARRRSRAGSPPGPGTMWPASSSRSRRMAVGISGWPGFRVRRPCCCRRPESGKASRRTSRCSRPGPQSGSPKCSVCSAAPAAERVVRRENRHRASSHDVKPT